MADIKQIVKWVGKAIFNAIFPTKCPVCDTFFSYSPDSEEEDIYTIRYRETMAPYFCPDCVTGFSPLDNPIYGSDLHPPRRFRIARALGAYEKESDNFAAIIRCYKYNTYIWLAEPLQKLLFSTFIRHWDKGEIDLVMPVPLHIKRFRKRGFNQAYLLIRRWPKLAESSGIDFSGIRIERDVIFRTRPTKPQARLKGREREENIRDAFEVRNASKIKGKRILMIDDVYTTGSTVDECARVLLENGAEYVDVLTLARTVNSS